MMSLRQKLVYHRLRLMSTPLTYKSVKRLGMLSPINLKFINRGRGEACSMKPGVTLDFQDSLLLWYITMVT